MKKIALLLALTLLLALHPLPSFAAEAAAPEGGGPTLISDRAGLEAIAQNPAGHYRLAADIDLSAAPWAPIPFSGVLEGDGHTIYNVTIRETDPVTAPSVDGNAKEYETEYAALFSRVSGGVLQDLSLLGVDVQITSAANCFAAGLVGYAEDVTITNCAVSGRVLLRSSNVMCGVAGLVGFGYGAATGCTIDIELTLVDESVGIKCEEFLGGALATGYLDIENCTLKTRGYASVFGYAHNGGIVGMYFVHTDDTGHLGYVTGNTVDAEITFFEANEDRRAYCDPVIGEVLNWSMNYEGNTVANYVNGETSDYDTILLPEMCAAPSYTESVSPPSCEAFGFTAHTCQTCGYSYADSYLARAHQPGEWSLIEATDEIGENGGDWSKLYERSCTLCDALLEIRDEPPIIEPRLEPETLRLHYKDTAQLTAALLPEGAAGAGVLYGSSDEGVAFVDQSGFVTATGRGSALITCTTAGGEAAAQCPVEVDYSFGQWLIVILLFGWIWY